jgi:AcrR family transcriptional regulator
VKGGKDVADNAAVARRTPLTRVRVLQAAAALADAEGIPALTIRSLAARLGVKPMAIYHHVATKEEILDELVDLVFAEIELPSVDDDWRAAMRRRATSARAALRRHRWAVTLLQSRATPGPATLRHHDAVIAVLRRAGFSLAMTAHAYAVLDAFVYGFAVQETSLPFDGPATVPEVASAILPRFVPDSYPHLVEFATQHVLQPGYDFSDEFSFGLDLVLDGLERAAATSSR